MKQMKCYVCKKVVISDALSRNNCLLCGMIMDVGGRMFCCEDCENKFRSIHNNGKNI